MKGCKGGCAWNKGVERIEEKVGRLKMRAVREIGIWEGLGKGLGVREGVKKGSGELSFMDTIKLRVGRLKKGA